MAYSKRELLERLAKFKAEHNRYPTRQDFRAKRITPSKNAFYSHFGSMEGAVKQAELYERGDLRLEEEQDQKHKRSVRQQKGSKCPFCGNQIRDAVEFYSSMTNIIINRFLDRLGSGNGDGYSDAVLDCIHDVFGTDNLAVRKELATAGYLEVFLKRDNRKKAPEEDIQEN